MSCFFDFSNEIFDIMNILGYKATESELQFLILKNSWEIEYILNLGKINTPEYLASSIDNFIIKIIGNVIENVELKNFTFVGLKQNKKDIYKLLKKIKSLISNEQKKKIFEKDIESLSNMFSLNLFNSKDKPENITNKFENHLKQKAQLIYKKINLYEDEINSKEFEIYYVKLIQSLIQMDANFKNVDKIFKFLNSFFQNNLKEKKNGNKIIINFYDLVQKEIYLDLKLMVNEIVLYIFRSIFNENIRIKEQYYRKKKEQTTKDIIVGCKENEEIIDDIFIYSNLFYLEYKNRNILKIFNKTGKELGLKDDEIISLKINKDIVDLNQNYQILNEVQLRHLNKCRRFIFPSLKFGEYNLEQKLNKFLSFKCKINHYIYYDNNKFLCEISESHQIMGGGGFPITFVNVEKGIVKNLEFIKDAPKWRIVEKGLNIFGICEYKKCEAFKKEVIYTTNLTETGLNFNLSEEIANIKCPICKKIIRSKTCGFWDCEYQFQGKKIEDGEIKSFETKPKETCEDKFEYFDPFENGEVQWLEFKIYVLPKQKIKYEENI